MSDTPDLAEVPELDLWAELVRRGAALHIGYCYPAATTDPVIAELVDVHGYSEGPWQFIAKDERLAQAPQWPMHAQVPDRFRRPTNG